MTPKNKKIARITPIPIAVAPALHIEVDRVGAGMAVLVSGARSIRDFSEECALLRIGGGYLKISGSSLSITLYENKVVEIVGRVLNFEFSYDKN